MEFLGSDNQPSHDRAGSFLKSCKPNGSSKNMGNDPTSGHPTQPDVLFIQVDEDYQMNVKVENTMWKFPKLKHVRNVRHQYQVQFFSA